MPVFLFSMNIDGKVLFMIISQGFTFATSLNLKSPYKTKHRLKQFVNLKDTWAKVFKNGLSKVCGSRPYHFKFFKGCLPQILLGPFLNTLTYMNLLPKCKSMGNFSY